MTLADLDLLCAGYATAAHAVILGSIATISLSAHWLYVYRPRLPEHRAYGAIRAVGGLCLLAALPGVWGWSDMATLITAALLFVVALCAIPDAWQRASRPTAAEARAHAEAAAEVYLEALAEQDRREFMRSEGRAEVARILAQLRERGERIDALRLGLCG